MKKSASLALAALLALSGVTAASAANRMAMASPSSKTPDTLSLSDTQQKSIWKDISRHASNQTAPSGFNAAVGTAIPATVSTYPLPRQAA